MSVASKRNGWGISRAVPAALAMLLTASALLAGAQAPGAAKAMGPRPSRPPRAEQAQRFLARRGWIAGQQRPVESEQSAHPRALTAAATVVPSWQPLGPSAVQSANYGLVTGRVSSVAFDPSDSTGNRVYVGTTGGGVWVSQNAAASPVSNVVFTPLTDAPAAIQKIDEGSISIGAVSVQPGGTGVLLAGTGDPNDALDSYYGVGILRSADGGNTWSLIQTTTDQAYGFLGEGFAGFAWSTVNPQLVVAAVSQAYEGTLVQAERPGLSYEGLYFSTDGGATWTLARITDANGMDVQGPDDAFAVPDGNAATSVVWNPVRKLFVAAVRYHGYYESIDGATWTRLATQPGLGLTAAMCPTYPGSTGSVACPIFRGTLAVNPETGDTFAWTVDGDNQDQGIWQDACVLGGGVCTNTSVSFSTRWNTAAIESNTMLGPRTVADGDYNLALAAVPEGQDTLLLAGANDLWECSLAAGCVWRNTTNANSCMSAQVSGYQHALGWNPGNPLQVFVGNDGGLWRSMDAIGETGQVCSPADATHFQNLNGELGSLAEVESMTAVTTSPYTMMAGLGVNGTAGVKSTTGPTAVWPQILSGAGGPTAVDPTNASNWYVNNGAGVSIHRCSAAGACTPSDFGAAALVTDADVSGDGYTMTSPAPFLVDPVDASQLLIGTCRLWRGPANGSGWSGANAISPFFDGLTGKSACNGDSLVRSMAALALPGGGEVVYVGMAGALDGGGIQAGHVFSATYDPVREAWSAWNDLTFNPVGNDNLGMNVYGLDISSIFIDPHDSTGNTVYVTVEGISNPKQSVRVAYRSTDGGAHWLAITSNLSPSAANSIVVDPQDANTVYIALDAGVYSTRRISDCTVLGNNCWSAYGTGLPGAPVIQLSAAPATVSPNVLVAGTYGRGIWQIPLLTAGTQFTTATVDPTDLGFASQAIGTSSGSQTVTLTNTGGIALTPTAISTSGDFGETDDCLNATVNAGASCTIQVTFAPTQQGDRSGQLTIAANVAGGQITVSLSGTGASRSSVSLTPPTLSFGAVAVGSTSATLQVTAENDESNAVPISNLNVTAPFALAGNACGTSIAANSECQLTVTFTPAQAGSAAGTLTLVDSYGTQTVALSGTGAAPATDTLSTTSLTFAGTAIGTPSSSQTVTISNSGGVPLNGISATASGPFQVSNGCGTQLTANSTCAVTVLYAPTAAGAQSGSLNISDALRSQEVTLSGTGLLPAVMSVSPASLTFPAQTIGATGAALTLTVSNTGGSPMANVGFQVTGPMAGSFSAGATTCGATLNGGGNCTVQVIFTPAVAGGNTAELTVSSATQGVKAVTVALNGAGTAASGLNVTPAQLSFSQAVIGQASAAQIVTVSNTSAVTAEGLTLAAPAPFSLTQNTCGTSLAAGAACTIGVVFTPVANGAVTGTLTVNSNTLNQAIVNLDGTGGLAGVVQLQPASLSFSGTGVGTTSSPQTVALTNSGTVALANLVLTVSSGFQLANTTCGTTLLASASCTASVAFAPTSAGQQTGNLTVASSVLASNAVASLSGTGVDFTVQASGAQSQSVASGQTASYTLVLTPANGSSGTFTFSCGALPANAVCSFNPNSETVAANSTGNVTVQVETGQSTSSARKAGTERWGVVPVICGILILPFAVRLRGRKLLIVVAGCLLAFGASSCSGSGGGTGGTPPANSGNTNTPAGTYAIEVSILSDGVSHSVTLSLTVE
ncbi:MAG TPA: choice-of-anchor D domain-containing protein [Terracidiphilus sp.]|nr:choice-of-anchor D domain-containing protein [Terracidiphilus sp.]